MKRRIAFILGVAATLAVASPVAAAPGAPPPTPTSAPTPRLPANALGIAVAQVAGNGLAVTLDSGASEEHDLVLSNHTADLRLSVRLTATDASGTLGAGAGSWLAFADDVVQIDPHAVATVPMNVAVPHDTQPGPVLAHVVATVESAVAAADGSPRAGTAQATFPVAITVSGTPTAQIAITDVHRVDGGGKHELAVVLRNYSNQKVAVDGQLRVFGSQPQTLPFHASLAPTRDTTLNLPWQAAPEGSGVEVGVEARYGSGDVASWSSTIGGPPTTLAAPSSGASSTTPTTAAPDGSAPPAAAPVSNRKPWYEADLIPMLVVLGLLAAVGWFVFELRSSKRRREEPMYGQPFVMMAPGSGSPDATAELARQLTRLTEIIVELSTNRAGATSGSEGRTNPTREHARAGPAPPPAAPAARTEEALNAIRLATRPAPDAAEPLAWEPSDRELERARSAASRPSDEARPDSRRSGNMRRLLALDKERRRIRAWLDAEEETGPGAGLLPTKPRQVFESRESTNDGPRRADEGRPTNEGRVDD